jgi:PPK2 family polyphosphate:nucleotide phosphotransferase
MVDSYLVEPNSKIRLSKIDPQGDSDQNKEAVEKRLLELNKELEELQEALYAQQKHKVLIILQGMDTSGKDGVIRHVFEGVNPQGVRVASFKQPTQEELAHDYLWRIHKQVPAKGEMVIFNRSHYEDVLIVRVHGLVAEHVWKRRYDQINSFEKMLWEEGTTILKFFLHIDKEEQKRRLQARLEDRKKQWKFNTADLKEREYWEDYQAAYEDVLNKTSTEYAPWYIIPSNKKWLRTRSLLNLLSAG